MTDLFDYKKESTSAIVERLKEADQDFEFYPTTREMIAPIYRSYDGNKFRINSFLDIGCGTCNFYKFLKEFIESDAVAQGQVNPKIPTYNVMEKSKILLNNLPKEAVVLGTDFETNALIDKPVDAIFCNPPYSSFVEWTVRIIRESTARFIYLVIPQRWKENAEIRQALTDTKSIETVLGSFDFLHAERQARAKVDVLYINKENCPKNKAFDDWFDSVFSMRDKKNRYEWEIDDDKKKSIKNQLVGAKNKVEMLVDFYNDELNTLQSHFKAITSLDVDILESIGVNKSAVKESLKNRIQGLKNRYWRIAFDELKEITSRLTSATKEKMYDRFQGLLTVDFNHDNIYSLVIWVCKNASAYYDEQLIELYKTFTTPENIIKYKSNQKVFQRDRWGHFDRETATHYCLSYRIICDRQLFRGRYSWRNEFDDRQSQTVVNDFKAIANNLGFASAESEIPSLFGEKYYIRKPDGSPLIEYKVYQNGNTHLKLDKEFAKAMNVEVSRLLGWIRNKSDVEKEFPDVMAKGAEKYFKTNFSIGLTGQNIKLLSGF